MAKFSSSSSSFVIIAICFFFVASAHCRQLQQQQDNRFLVEGKVYCDTCRLQYITKASEYMAGATVRVECKEENGTLTVRKEAVTDGSGSYKVEVDGDHEDEICSVRLVQSSRVDCTDIDTSSYLAKTSIISITNNNGIVSPVRSANPLGFLIKNTLPTCKDLFSDQDLADIEDYRSIISNPIP